MTAKLIDLAKKLKALADRGEGGEKENAENKLLELMLKHNITLDDIEENRIESHVFKIELAYRRFFMQIVCSVDREIKIFGSKAGKTYFIVDCTASQAIEIQSKYDFYLERYKKELAANNEIFYNAFVQKNALYSSGDPQETKDLTPDELQRVRKILKLADELEGHNYLKQIGG